MCMVDYAEPFVVCTIAKRTARKAHKCDECGREIAPGETYETWQGLEAEWRMWSRGKTCAHCIWARGWLNVQCNGFVYAGVREDLEEHWLEDPLLRSIDLGRRIVGMRNRWRKKDGTLMAVPA